MISRALCKYMPALFIGLASATHSNAAPGRKLVSIKSQIASCAPYLTETSSGETPESFFREHKKEQSPRYVLLMGVPGAGKSTWATAAEKNGWVVINTDRIRQDLLRELKAKGEKVRLADGSEEIPNENDPRHLFTPEHIVKGIQIGAEQVKKALASGKSVVDDKVNGNLLRAKGIVEARKQGYFVEGLVFYSPEVETNLANIRIRTKAGGFGPKEESVRALFNDFMFYTKELQLDPNYRTPRVDELPELSSLAVSKVTKHFASITDALINADHETRELLLKYYSEDVFNRLGFVLTSNWADSK